MRRHLPADAQRLRQLRLRGKRVRPLPHGGRSDLLDRTRVRVSAGAVNTLAARGVAHFRDLMKITGERAPLKRTVEVEEVGRATLFLASDLSSGITGETMYVDAGFNITAG